MVTERAGRTRYNNGLNHNKGGDKFSTRHFTDEEKARRRAARHKARGKTPSPFSFISADPDQLKKSLEYCCGIYIGLIISLSVMVRVAL